MKVEFRMNGKQLLALLQQLPEELLELPVCTWDNCEEVMTYVKGLEVTTDNYNKVLNIGEYTKEYNMTEENKKLEELVINLVKEGV